VSGVVRIVELRPDRGRDRSLERNAAIGREGTDVILDDEEVSRRHAEIVLSGDVASIRDLGSRNGTFVNDEELQGTRELREGDELRFGATVWRVEDVPAGGTRVAPRAQEPGRSEDALPRASRSAPLPAADGASALAGINRGDVPSPLDPAASAVRPIAPADAASPPSFDGARERPRVRSAATSGRATAIAMLVLALDAIGVAVFFLLR